VALTGGPVSGDTPWFGYGLLGTRLQNDVVYVPVTSDGLIYDHAMARRQPADASSWLRRLRERKIDYVASMSGGIVEIAWMLANPHIFELVTPDKVTRDKGRGVWRVHFPPSSSP